MNKKSIKNILIDLIVILRYILSLKVSNLIQLFYLKCSSRVAAGSGIFCDLDKPGNDREFFVDWEFF